jgi:hypothetical protein
MNGAWAFLLSQLRDFGLLAGEVVCVIYITARVELFWFTPLRGKGSAMTTDHTVLVTRVGSTVIPIALASSRP